ncbi:unnamed protein product [Onchocerca ochengi]|uniref:BZIP domain-containing protein n=1 Tax=Onchocerca ochengi TaxID=42157 RepID=A0A182ERW4_ONCOC|nr:unnamed protein product [Onchocerca ochengi]
MIINDLTRNLNHLRAHYQLNMPQAYQTRTGFVGNTMTRPASATGKRGGRRPKEYEEYDHVTLSEEERDKRDKRRLRNKEAAARCRQRRLDLMGSLQNVRFMKLYQMRKTCYHKVSL